MSSASVEKIEKAALTKDGQVFSVPRPARHNHVIYFAHKTLGLSEDPVEPLNEDVQGFVTSTGRFVDRAEAAKIALEAGQIPEAKDALYSEDVWDTPRVTVILPTLQYAESFDRFEALYLQALMKEADGVMAKAAEIAGLDRRTMLRKLRKHRINRKDFRKP